MSACWYARFKGTGHPLLWNILWKLVRSLGKEQTILKALRLGVRVISVLANCRRLIENFSICPTGQKMSGYSISSSRN